MAVRRERVTLVLHDSFSGRLATMADAVRSFGAAMDRRRLNAHPLDRVDRNEQADPHRWPGDDS